MLPTLLLCSAAAVRPPPLLQRLPPEAVELTGAFGGALLLRSAVLDARHVPTDSMTPTLEPGDFLLLDKVTLRMRAPERGDVVVFRPPPALASRLEGEQFASLGDLSGVSFVKRVVAVAGDTVAVRRGRLVLNGREQREAYVRERIGYRMRRVTVPPGHVFVMGDNRNNSCDSHVWGCLGEGWLLGVARCTYWPPRRACRSAAYARGGAAVKSK